ncbi:MAG: methyltransferase domain-containing protein [Rikenellaceae bacterium]
MNLNKDLIQKRFAARLESYNKYALVQNRICEHLGLLTDKFVDCEVRKALEIGAGTGFLTSILTSKFGDSQWYINDITSEVKPFIERVRKTDKVAYLFGDAEKIDFSETYDLVVSSSVVQWFDDFEGFVDKLDVNSGGYVVISSFGQRNFEQIKGVLGVGLRYMSLNELESVFEGRGYEIIHSEQQIETLEFNSPLEVLKHIKMTGVNSVENFVWTRNKLNDFCKEYEKQYINDLGCVTLTYNPTILIAKKKWR